MRHVLFNLVLLIAVVPSQAANPDFSYRRGSRALAMGEAGAAASSSGPESLAWNPAGLARQRRIELTLEHTDWSGLNLEAVGLATPFFGGALGADLSHDSFESMIGRDELGQPTGELGYNTTAGSLAYAYALRDFAGGIEFGSWSHAFGGIVSSGFNINAGMMWTPGIFSLGISGFQLESKPLAQISEAWVLPVLGNKLTQNLGYIAEGVDSRIGAGLELSFFDIMAFRVGYQRPTEGQAEGPSGLSFGLGAHYLDLSLDFAYLPLDDLGRVERIQLGYQFKAPSLVAVSRTSEEGSEKKAKLKFVVPSDENIKH